MEAYHCYLWNKALPSLHSASGKYKSRGLAFHHEGMALARQERNMARHIIEVPSRHMATVIALRRHAWLRSAHTSNETHMRIEDLLFDSTGLFDEKNYDILDNLQKLEKTAKSYNT